MLDLVKNEISYHSSALHDHILALYAAFVDSDFLVSRAPYEHARRVCIELRYDCMGDLFAPIYVMMPIRVVVESQTRSNPPRAFARRF